MKVVKFLNILLLFLIVCPGLAVVSCKKKDLTPDTGRLRKDRGITIIDNIGNDITGYAVNAGEDGPEIVKGTNFTEKTIYIKISDNWKKDPDLEVILVDRYKNIYKNTVNVPLEGNTDIRIGKNNKVSQGVITDAMHKLVEIFNRTK